MARPATSSSVASATGMYAGPGFARLPSGSTRLCHRTNTAKTARPPPATRSTVSMDPALCEPEEALGIRGLDPSAHGRRQPRPGQESDWIVLAHVEGVITADHDAL